MEHGRPAVIPGSASCDLDRPLKHPRPTAVAGLGLLLLLYFGLALKAHATDAWLPVTSEELAMNPKNYDQVRNFYQAVRAGDDEQIIITH